MRQGITPLTKVIPDGLETPHYEHPREKQVNDIAWGGTTVVIRTWGMYLAIDQHKTRALMSR